MMQSPATAYADVARIVSALATPGLLALVAWGGKTAIARLIRAIDTLSERCSALERALGGYAAEIGELRRASERHEQDIRELRGAA